VQWFYCSRSDEEEEQSGASKNMHITSFFKQAGSNKRQKTKHTFFTVRNLDVLDSLWFECDVFFFFGKMCIRCVEEARTSVQNVLYCRDFLLWKRFFFVHIFLYMTTYIIKLSKITWFIPCSNWWCRKWHSSLSHMTVFHIIVIMFRYYCKFWFDFNGVNDSFFLGLQIKSYYM